MVVALARVTNKFCDVWSNFEVWFWWMSDKRDESTWRGQIMLMMSQMPNGRSNAIGLDQDLVWLEVANLESKEKNWKNDKEELKKSYIAISHDCANWIKKRNQLQWKKWISHHYEKFRMKLWNDPKSHLLLLLMLEFCTTMQKWWSLCEMIQAHAKWWFWC